MVDEKPIPDELILKAADLIQAERERGTIIQEYIIRLLSHYCL